MRETYTLIIGRAGRANVAVEGIVIVLNSDARTLKDIVHGSLWTDVQRDRVQGQLSQVSPTIGSVEELTAYQEVAVRVWMAFWKPPGQHWKAVQPKTWVPLHW